MINNYAGLAIWGIAFLTQSLSFAGLLAEINVMTWTYGVGFLGTIVTVVYNIFYLLSLWSLYDKNQNPVDNNDANKSGQLFWQVQGEWIRGNAATAFVGALLFGAYENWMAAQNEAINAAEESATEEDQAAEEVAAEPQTEPAANVVVA